MPKLYKYQGIEEYHFEYLRKSQIWAATYDSLNDVNELMLYKEKVNQNKEPYGNLSSDISFIINDEKIKGPLIEKIRGQYQGRMDRYRNIGIYSLSKDPLDEVMWAHYANNHAGFVIEFDRDALEADLLQEGLKYPPKDILYRDELPFIHGIDAKKLDEDDGLDPGTKMFMRREKILYFVKSKKWELEDEVRMLFSVSGKKEISSKTIVGIYFGIRMSNDQKKIIINNLKSSQHIKYYQVAAQDRSFELIRKELTSEDIKQITTFHSEND